MTERTKGSWEKLGTSAGLTWAYTEQSSGGLIGGGGGSKVTSLTCLQSGCSLLPMIIDLENLSSFSSWCPAALNSRGIFRDCERKARNLLEN